MPLRDKKHLALIRMLTCVRGINCMGDVVPAHIRKFSDGGTGIKPSDNLTVPLCVGCYDLMHKGEVTFWGGVDGVYKAIDFAKSLYGVDIFKANRLVMEARCDLFS